MRTVAKLPLSDLGHEYRAATVLPTAGSLMNRRSRPPGPSGWISPNLGHPVAWMTQLPTASASSSSATAGGASTARAR